RLSGVDRFPNPLSLTTYCVCLELRSLPSAGIARVHRDCEPLRHPMTPGLSLSGIRLVIPDHAIGLPALRTPSLCTCRRHYPDAPSGPILRSLTQTYQPSPIGLSGRPTHRPFRGLPSVHSSCGLHTRAVTDS